MKKLPAWFVGFIVCFIIFIITHIVFSITLENLVQTSSGSYGELSFGPGLIAGGIYIILIPIIMLISGIISFFQRKDSPQGKRPYIIITLSLIVLGIIFSYLLKYIFPISNQTNVQVCSIIKNSTNQRGCYENFAIREKDSSICAQIENSARFDGIQETYQVSCRIKVMKAIQAGQKTSNGQVLPI